MFKLPDSKWFLRTQKVSLEQGKELNCPSCGINLIRNGDYKIDPHAFYHCSRCRVDVTDVLRSAIIK